eukprot:CAMPEP_0179122648 /NCGR_PEP_ID=MMETSP0796-20121207/57892_1 /TAXON_ID=73915 /ORGANISM="Pyrodinium bahamense, Strain pbaha01" /LENGTH=239 /DNA_ID=CAMNT_0020821273 /DNA_START=42 /DNA_END=761 /DNA_ORIENTATION=+
MAPASALQPVTTFCCGCPLDFGIQVILSIHLFVSCFYMVTGFCNVVLDERTLGYHASDATQAFNCGFALAGLPFLVSGASGLKYHIEIHLRLYLYWLMLTFALDVVFLLVLLYMKSCVRMPEALIEMGGSFACGTLRLGSVTMLVLYVVLMGYAVYIIWSRCEQLQFGGSDASFTGLVGSVHEVSLPQHRVGLFGTGPRLSQPQAIEYGSLASEPFEGSARIFSGKCHDCSFPPRGAAA